MNTTHRSRRPSVAAMLLAALLCLLPSWSVAAQEPTLATVALEPPAGAAPDTATPYVTGQGAVSWKVVYVVGYVSATESYAAQANADAVALRGMGMTVVTFVPGDNDWASIVAAAADADVFVYAGHGMSWGDPPVVGGMSLSATQKVSPDEIRQRLRLAPNAVVILNHVCFASGGSVTDSGAITPALARQRVAQYSDPFLDVGAVGYYSNWYYDFPVKILTYLAGGLTLGQAYEQYQDFSGTNVERYAHPDHPQYAMWLDWSGPDDDHRMYDYAFAGDEDLNLLNPPSSAVPASIGRQSVQVRTEPGAGTFPYEFAVSTGDATVGWTASLDGSPSWVSASPTTGQSGATLRLTFTAPLQAGTYQAALRLHTSDASVSPSDTLVPITLVVAPPALHEVHLPSVHG